MGVLALGDNLTVVEKNLSTTSLSLRSVILPLALCHSINSENKRVRWNSAFIRNFNLGYKLKLSFLVHTILKCFSKHLLHCCLLFFPPPFLD